MLWAVGADCQLPTPTCVIIGDLVADSDGNSVADSVVRRRLSCRPVADQSPTSRRPVVDQSSTSRRPVADSAFVRATKKQNTALLICMYDTYPPYGILLYDRHLGRVQGLEKELISKANTIGIGIGTMVWYSYGILRRAMSLYG